MMQVIWVIQILWVMRVILWEMQVIWVPSSVKGSTLFRWAGFLLPEVYSELLQSCRSPTCVDKEGCCLLFDSEMSISIQRAKAVVNHSSSFGLPKIRSILHARDGCLEKRTWNSSGKMMVLLGLLLAVGKLVFLLNPSETTGANRKFARPFHGPYRITRVDVNNAYICCVDRLSARRTHLGCPSAFVEVPP